MDGVNAQNKDTTRRSNSCRGQSIQSRLGEIPGDSRSDGARPIRTSETGDSGVHTYHCPHCGYEDEIIGKILERLDKLEKSHLEYVDAHQGRLRARLGESESSKDKFLQEAGDLRGDIYALITSSQHCNNCND